jgi:CRP/FNR family transcriptional regulator
MITVVDRLKNLDLFTGLPDGEIEKLAAQSLWTTYLTGDTVFTAGDEARYAHIIGYGAVKLVRHLDNGSEVTMHFIPRGQIFGAVVAMREGAKYPLTAIALEDTGVLRISREAFRESFQNHSVVGPRLLMLISQRITEMHSEKAMLKSTVQKRIAEFILRTLESQTMPSGGRIMMRLTRQDIANRVGTTVETVIRTLSQWTQLGLITTEDHRIEVLKKEALAEILENN